MRLIILFLYICNIMSCASSKKCANVDGFNPVFEKSSCRLQIRNTFFADQLSSEIKDKIRQGQRIEFVWMPTVQKGQSTVPAHFEVKTVLGDDL